MRIRTAFAAAAVLSVVGLSGCDLMRMVRPPAPNDERAERLRLPPDLSASSSDAMNIPGGRFSDFQRGQPLLADGAEIQVRKAGDERWLEVPAAPEQVWKWLRGYLKHSGIPVVREVPRLGLIQTDWILHPVAAPRGIFSPEIRESKDTRVADYYLFRIEPGREAGSSEIYVAQRRTAAQGSGANVVWNWRPADPFLEAEMLRGLMIFMGAQRVQSTQQVAAAEAAPAAAQLQRAEGGQPVLVVDSRFFDAWRQVGIALDRLGFTLEDRDRSQGQYFVRYDPEAEAGAPEKGLLATLAFWRRDPPDSLALYVLNLKEEGGRTVVDVTQEDGAAAAPEVAERMLALLAEQLR